MFNYKLPKNNNNIKNEEFSINLYTKDSAGCFLSYTVSKYVNMSKQKIDEYIDSWDSTKKFTNPYEFIHTQISMVKPPISKIKPLSRAFFKLIEIFNLLEYKKTDNITTFHLAEGPGGFIEATAYYRKNPEDKYYGMSLIKNGDINIPGWDKATHFLKNNKNVEIVNGPDNTGNLYSPCNFDYCFNTFKNSKEIITADGGFDFSIDFNKQEHMASRLILTEVFYAIMMQKKDGVFILKMFDTFLKPSSDILYILTSFYETVRICKPNTSRIANSERYIVCSGFKYNNTESFYDTFRKILVYLNQPENNEKYLECILNIQLNYSFKKSMEEINAIFAYKQINNILTTIRFIENNEKKTQKIQTIKSNNIKLCIEWCQQNNIPYNKLTDQKNKNMNSNIFIQRN